MYIEPLDDEPCAVTQGVWKDPFTSFWNAVVEVDGEVFDLGRFGNFVEAGERYLAVKKALEAVV